MEDGKSGLFLYDVSIIFPKASLRDNHPFILLPLLSIVFVNNIRTDGFNRV